ncbi:MAG: tetratricopeptide repeat protein [Spirochaetes bacterium]|nr:tetratricopeptide repeat protein [Spirochaetota bacterium]
MKAYAFRCMMLCAAIIVSGCASFNYTSATDRLIAFQTANDHYNKGKMLFERISSPALRTNEQSADALHREAYDHLAAARDIYEQLFEREKNETIILSLGQTYKLLGEPEKATKTFLYVINNINKSNTDALSELGYTALYYRNDLEDARRWYERILAIDSDNAEAAFYAGYTSYRLNDRARAKKHFSRLVSAQSPGQYRRYAELYLGVLSFYDGEYEECVRLLEPLANESYEDPDRTAWLVAFYKSCQVLERFRDAYEAVAMLAAKHPADMYYTGQRYLLAELAAVPLKDRPPEPKITGTNILPFFIPAIRALSSNDITAARAAVLREMNQPSIEAMQLMRHIERKSGDTFRAQKAELDLSGYYFANGIYSMAIRHLTNLVTQKKYQYLYYDLSHAYMKSGDTVKSADAAAAYVRADITHKTAALTDVADFLMRSKRYPDAIIANDRIIKILPDATFAWLNKGLIYAEQKDEKQALRMTEKALSLLAGENDNAKKAAYYSAGTIYLMFNRVKDATNVLSRALALDPEDPNALNALGYTFIDRDVNVPEGVRMVEKAISYRTSPHFLDSLGWGYYKQRRYDDAKRELLKALAGYTGDGFSVVCAHLADVYLATGDRENALIMFKKALDADEHSSEFDEAAVRKKVKALEGVR